MEDDKNKTNIENQEISFPPQVSTDTSLESTSSSLIENENKDNITQTLDSTPDVSTQDVSTQDVSTQDVSTQDVSTQDVSTQDVSTQDVSTQDVSTQDVSTQDVSTQDVSTQDVSTQDVSTDTTLYDKQPFQEESSQEESSQEQPFQEQPSQEESFQEQPFQEESFQEQPQNEITQEELQELEERELSLRSKILNQPLPCKKKQQIATPFIEKIQVKTPLTDNEETISRQIKEQCPQAFLYFQPLIETSPLQINTITECEDGTEQPSNPTDELIETKYKNTTTQPLAQFLEYQITPQNQTTPQKQKNIFIQLIVHTHLQLLHSIKKLQELTPPIIHFHLTPETLHYNTIDATPVITDFRLAFTKTTIEDPEENKELFPPYENIPQYPFEVFLLSKIADLPEDTPLDTDTLTKITEAFKQQTNLDTPITTPYETTPKDIRTKVIAHHKTWDPYAIHHYIYSFLTIHQIPTDKPFMTQYKDLLVSYLTTEPGQRPSIETTQENIKNIFKSVPKKDYLGFLTALQTRV